MAQTGKYKFRVEPRDLDFSLRPTLVAVGDYFLDAAGLDADKNGFGVRNLNQDNCSWVISRMALELERYPGQYEDFTVGTWVSEVGRLMTTRNLIMEDTRGKRIGAAVTNWAMINLETRRPMDLSSNPLYTNAVLDREPPIERPAKIRETTPSLTAPHKVVYSDIDFNGHANSMRYLSWMTDILPMEYHKERMFHRFDINFNHEARLGEQLEVRFEDAGEQSLFEIRNESGAAICRAAIAWKK